MGRDHVRRITDKCGNAQVVGVYDTVLGNAKQAIEDNRLDATIYDSADALIDDPNVDAVVIASRNDVHLDPLLHTIAIGKPTFTEKPMTINGSDSWKVVEAEVAKGRKTIQVGFNWRFDPGYDAMKTFVGDGQIGALLMAGMRHYNAQASTSYYSTDNVINDTLIHNFDMLHYMFDGDITSVEMKFARMNTLNPNGESLREPQLAIVEFSDGALATAEANVNCQYATTSNAAWSRVRHHLAAGCRHAGGAQGRSDQPRDLVRLVRPIHRGIRPRVRPVLREYRGRPAAGRQGGDAWDGYVANVVADAALDSLHHGGRIPVTLNEQPALYR